MQLALFALCLLLGFFAVIYLGAHAGIAFFKGLLWLLLLPLKIVIVVLGFLVWLLFMPFKLLLIVAMGLLGLLMIPLVAAFLCLAALLFFSC